MKSHIESCIIQMFGPVPTETLNNITEEVLCVLEFATQHTRGNTLRIMSLVTILSNALQNMMKESIQEDTTT